MEGETQGTFKGVLLFSLSVCLFYRFTQHVEIEMHNFVFFKSSPGILYTIKLGLKDNTNVYFQL